MPRKWLTYTLKDYFSLTDLQTRLLKEELQLEKVQDLVHLFPYKYIDRTKYYKINELHTSSAEVQIIGKFTGIKTLASKGGKRLTAQFTDNTGNIEVVWFRVQQWLIDSIQVGIPYVIFGKVGKFNNIYQIAHPEMELLVKHQQNKTSHRIQPIYPSTEKLAKKGINNRQLSKMVYTIFERTQANFAETLSQGLIRHLQLLSKSEALMHIHFPASHQQLSRATFRLKFEELFYAQLRILYQREQNKKLQGFCFDKVGTYFNAFYKNGLSFKLTTAQKRVLKEIRMDMGQQHQMNRLLQGDVGSGKTVVAFMSCLIALDNGYQACVLAPTEILAQQHHEGFVKMAEMLDLKIGFLSGSTKTSTRKVLFPELLEGEIQILIGTHAILENTVQFKNLGIAIIDEQHRFGVAQRSKLWAKNKFAPHILSMSATPIPRTLAMSIYGDLDISLIDEMPPGRKEIKTMHRRDSHRLEVFYFIKQQIALDRQIYIVYPLIEESEKMDYKDLMDGFVSIEREFPKPQYQISIVHGRMKTQDKDYEMQRFAKGETQIMVATTVIEVGVNIPNASVMVIESAERFGLSQLHQLRGRVGRGAEQSYCILMTGHKLSTDTRTRINTMVGSNDGFEIAEVDLKLRGSGDMMGTQQSGMPNLRIANIIKDTQILQLARGCVQQILAQDPNLENKDHQNIIETYRKLVDTSFRWDLIS